MKKAFTIFYVVSLPHSGSTLLCYLLSRIHGSISLGELRGLGRHDKDMNELCSCGVKGNACSFWSTFHWNDESFENKYSDVVKRCMDLGYTSLIDSSKEEKTLEKVSAVCKKLNVQLQIVYIQKDPREWIFSMMRKMRKQGKTDSRVKLFVKWIKNDIMLRRLFRKKDISFVETTYRDLCSHTDDELKRISTFFSVSLEPISHKQHHHIIYGNRMRSSLSDLTIRYDDEWKKSKKNRLLYYLFSPILFFGKILFK